MLYIVDDFKATGKSTEPGPGDYFLPGSMGVQVTSSASTELEVAVLIGLTLCMYVSTYTLVLLFGAVVHFPMPKTPVPTVPL